MYPSSVLEAIETARSTRVLNLAGEGLTEVPEAVFDLRDLRELSLAYNALTELPERLTGLEALLQLDLQGNQLSRLPDSMGGLRSLFRLNLWANQIQELPESLTDITGLESLYLSHNALTQVPQVVGRLARLKRLYLPGNQLSALPSSLAGLRQLETLDISYNAVTEVPEVIRELKRLRRLYFANNQITEIPPFVVECARLSNLQSSGNLLEGIPAELAGLRQLRILNLAYNRLQELPEALKWMRLDELYLHGNEGLGLQPEILGPEWRDRGRLNPASPADILEYYFRVQDKPQPLNEAKLILVGRGGVGKTSLVKRLVDNQFDPTEAMTEGIQITKWTLPLSDKEEVRLHIWDFGGQEILHATHQFFLTQRSLYLLVLNGRLGEEDAEADYWLRLIEGFGGESAVIVVLNKTKEHPFDLNRPGLQRRYPIRDFIQTDCGDGTGIQALRDAIRRETDRLEHLRDSFPANWFKIKNQLGEMKQSYLSFSEFREICSTHGETDPVAQNRLAGYLHNLGIVLNYKDDPRLQDLNVLNPHWVTKGIYRILNSELLKRQGGEIRLSDLDGVLDAVEYPPHTRRFILDLMKKFDLCFSFPDDETHYLIPELLDKPEPEDTAEFAPEACLNFQYQYPVIPEGLMPRLIVRTHVLSRNQPRWKTGVILQFEGNRALVKADPQERKVQIFVTGPVSGRRRLLAVIRADLEQIHSNFSNLQPEAMVPVPEHPRTVVPYHKLLVLEQQGFKDLVEVLGDHAIRLDVSVLLNGVDLGGTRSRSKAVEEPGTLARVFVSYSHKDETLWDELLVQLKLLKQAKLIETWSDRDINAGDDWKMRIDENLDRADVILLLVSPDFLASDYCVEIEIKRAMERQRQGEARVIPIILRETRLQHTLIANLHLQALPKDAKPVVQWADRDSAWRSVADGIEAAVTGQAP